MKQLSITRFLSLFFVALAFAPSAAHLLELPHKIAMPASEYAVVQQIYRGWAALGIVVYAALLATAAYVLVLRSAHQPYALAAAALVCLVAAQAVFWLFTYPANQQTQNWTTLPADWSRLRAQWEYSHAAGALCNLGAFVALLWGTVRSAGLQLRPGTR
jgi:hypothetical protein